jgi:Arc/MetJ family transcription regulator
MRINIDIDDALMAAAMKAGGFATKKETVEEALRLLVRKQAYEGIRALRGTVVWAGDLSQMRRDRVDYREPIIVKKALAKRLKKTAQL